MKYLRSFLIIVPAACLLAQTPPAQTPAPAAPPAVAPNAPKLATPVPPRLIAPAAAPTPVTVPPDRVVLKAGSVTLTAAQFDDIISGLPEMYQVRFRGPGRKQFADSLVKLYILSDEGRRLKLDETHAYKVQSTLNDDQSLANLVVEKIKADTKIDDAEARKYYDEHLKDYEEVTARHILIRAKGSQVPLKPGAKELTDEEALAKAKDIHKRIVAGEDFATIAKTESDDSTAGDGGLLPVFGHGRMTPSFEQAAFSLKPGKLGEPVKSPFGYHIIKVDAHTTKTFEQVRPDIDKKLIPPKAQQTLQDMTKDAFYDPDFFPAQKPPMPPSMNMPHPMPPHAAPGAPGAPAVPPVPAAPPAPATPPKQ